MFTSLQVEFFLMEVKAELIRQGVVFDSEATDETIECSIEDLDDDDETESKHYDPPAFWGVPIKPGVECNYGLYILQKDKTYKKFYMCKGDKNELVGGDYLFLHIAFDEAMEIRIMNNPALFIDKNEIEHYPEPMMEQWIDLNREYEITGKDWMI